MRSRARTLVLGASHWHMPLYAERIAALHDVVAFSDPDPAMAARYSPLWDAPHHLSWADALADHADAELAYVLVPHDEMRDACLALVSAGIPIVVEKPAGLSLEELFEIRNAAEAAGVPVAIPLVQRDGPVDLWLAKAGPSVYESVQFIAGPPDRYLANGNPWMLDLERAGGGCMINLAPHFVDLFLRSAGAREATVTATLSSLLHGRGVEDYASMRVHTDEGQIATIEVGYAFPESPLKRHCSYVRTGPAGMATIGTDGRASFTSVDGSTQTELLNVDSDPLYGVFVERVAAGLDRHFEGLPQIADLQAAMAVIWQAYSYDRQEKTGAHTEHQ